MPKVRSVRLPVHLVDCVTDRQMDRYIMPKRQILNKETFHPEILRNCKNGDIGNVMYPIPDLTIPRMSFYEFGIFLPTVRSIGSIGNCHSKP